MLSAKWEEGRQNDTNTCPVKIENSMKYNEIKVKIDDEYIPMLAAKSKIKILHGAPDNKTM